MVKPTSIAFCFLFFLTGCLSSPSPQILEIQKTHAVESVVFKMIESGESPNFDELVIDGEFNLDVAAKLIPKTERDILEVALDEVVFLDGFNEQKLRENPYMLIAIAKSPWPWSSTSQARVSSGESEEISLVRIYYQGGSSLAKLSTEDHDRIKNGLKNGQVFDCYSLGSREGMKENSDNPR